MKKLICMVVMLVLALGFAGCTSDQPVTTRTETQAQGTVEEQQTQEDTQSTDVIRVTDLAGREIELEKPAERIVDCTGLRGSRVLVQMEAEDLLVGVTERVNNAVGNKGMFTGTLHLISIAAPELAELPLIGTYNEPNIEVILGLEPDVILIGWGGAEQAESLMKQTGIPTVCIDRKNGQFDYDIYEIVGKVIGKEAKAQELITYLEETMSVVTNVTSEIPQAEKKSLFFWVYPSTERSPMSNGVYDAFDYAGAINVASNDEGIALYEMTKEQIAAWDADFLFLQSYVGAGDGFVTPENIKDDPIMQHTRAVENGNVYYLRGPKSDFDMAIEAAEVFYVARLLYPEKFAELDVDKYCNEIFEKLYGVENLYSEMRDFAQMESWE